MSPIAFFLDDRLHINIYCHASSIVDNGLVRRIITRSVHLQYPHNSLTNGCKRELCGVTKFKQWLELIASHAWDTIGQHFDLPCRKSCCHFRWGWRKPAWSQRWLDATRSGLRGACIEPTNYQSSALGSRGISEEKAWPRNNTQVIPEQSLFNTEGWFTKDSKRGKTTLHTID